MAINDLIAQGAQTRGINPLGLFSGVENIRSARSQNELLNLQVQNEPARQARLGAQETRAVSQEERVQNEFERGELFRGANDVVKGFESGDRASILQAINRLPDTGRLGEIKNNSLVAMSTDSQEDDLRVLQQARSIVQQGQEEKFFEGGAGTSKAQFGNSRPVVATTQAGVDINGVIADIRDANTGEVRTEFIPDVAGKLDPNDPIVSTSNVGRTGITGEDQNEAIRLRQQELERLKTQEGRTRKENEAQITRLTGFADSGLTAAQAHTTTKRSLELLDQIETGGFEGVALRARQLFGIQSADEAELSTGMLRVVLAQLKPVFGAAFTRAEGESLKAIEANIGKSTEGNKRLLRQLLTMQERSARRGASAARQIKDSFTADEIEAELQFNLGGDSNNVEQARQPQEGDIIVNNAGDRLILQNGQWEPFDGS